LKKEKKKTIFRVNIKEKNKFWDYWRAAGEREKGGKRAQRWREKFLDGVYM